jgi:hypothetical protein
MQFAHRIPIGAVAPGMEGTTKKDFELASKFYTKPN